MQKLKVAIVGAGTAGLATAAFLSRQGHDVTIFERFDVPKPMGAGLLLQPTGLSVLALLGIDQQVISAGSRINRLYGKVSGSKSVTLDVRYESLNPNLFGIGIHRASLFSALHDLVKQNNIHITTTSEITAIRQEKEKAIITNVRGESHGLFDLVVDASGTKSVLRKQYADVKLDKAYPYGALWATVKNANGTFAYDILTQRYKNAHHMIGVLPVGRVNDEPHESAAFFWSIRVRDYKTWREKPLEQWQEYVSALWPETQELLTQFKSHDDLAFATYSDVILRKYHSGNIVFIGDAAHCTSPQLGQGANLALMDAMVLAECIKEANTISNALIRYDKTRKDHLRFYQMASRILTPFFQSDSLFCAKLRFFTCGLACKIPLTQKIAAHVLTGTKTGLFLTLNPGTWAKDYELFNRSSNALIE